jgi:glycosyltransferase involved in cell wall biosynthesis
VPTGIASDRFPPTDAALRRARRLELGLPPNAPVVGIVATLRSWKGHRYLIEALRALPDARTRLVIVGDGPQREALAALAAAPDIAGRVIFAGNRNDVAPWLQSFDVFALPSYANEGVPQALLQAMFTGLPAVTTDAGAIPEIAIDGETALVVPRKTPPRSPGRWGVAGRCRSGWTVGRAARKRALRARTDGDARTDGVGVRAGGGRAAR